MTTIFLIASLLIATIYAAINLGGIEEPVTAQFCVRTFSNYGDEGCRSRADGALDGLLFEVRTVKDIYNAINFEESVAILAPSTMYTNDMLSLLERSRDVIGIIIYDDDNINMKIYESTYSTDVEDVSPFGGSKSAVKRAWNPYGNGIMRRSLSVPLVHIGGDTIAELKRLCKENSENRYHKGAFVHMASFDAYMGGAGITSKDCINWKDIYGAKSPKCLPIGGLSVWATAGVLDGRDKVVATAAMDGVAEFHDLANAANDAASSIAALLIAAESLGRIPDILQNLPRQLLFFLPDADEWGATGSRRFVADLQSFHCNFKLNDTQTTTGLPACTDPVYPSLLFEHLDISQIRAIFAVDQIALNEEDVLLQQQQTSRYSDGHATYEYDNKSSSLYIRTASSSPSSCGDDDNSGDNRGDGDDDVTTLEDIATAVADIDGLTLMKATALEVPNGRCQYDVLPPTPMATILEAIHALAGEEDRDSSSSSSSTGAKVNGYLFTGYNTEFVNPRYHTRLDVGAAVNINHIRRAALALSRSLFLAAGGAVEKLSLLTVDADWANEVISCLLYDWGCAMMDRYTESEQDDVKSVAGETAESDHGGASTVGQEDDGTVELPMYYSGVFSTGSGGGQPVVKVLGKGQGDLFTKYSKSDWNPQVNKLFVIPNKLQAFVRNVLLYHLGTNATGINPTGTNPSSSRNEINEGMNDQSRSMDQIVNEQQTQKYCMTSADCGKCIIASYGYKNVSMQCVLSKCICPSAFYHIALDPGLIPEKDPGVFEMVDESAPCYTEPYWQKLSFTVYTSSSHRTNYIIFGIGIVVLLFSVVATWYLQHFLVKRKLL